MLSNSRMLLMPLDCPHCGAPLPEDAIGTSVTTCPYCKRALAVEPGVVFAKAFARAAALRDEEANASPDLVRVGDVPYVVEGRIARGESSDVFLARRAHRVTERVVIKVLRALGDAPRMQREAETLRALEGSTTHGTGHFSRLVPQLVQESTLVDDDRTTRPALVVRRASGFCATLADARAAFPDGVDPRAAVWMWRRVLELLAWVHGTGRVHGAVVPEHVVLHARDHGVMLVDWAASVGFGARIDAIVGAHAAFYPEGASTDEAQPAIDLAMTARCIAFVLGGEPQAGKVPSTVASPIARLVADASSGRLHADAGALHRIVGDAAREAFGPPTYVPFELPTRR
jgi:hypothetical protein